MPVGITDLAHSLRKNTASSAVPISLSHGQQLVCAALGHKSLASFQAAREAEREPQDFNGLSHVAPDYELLTARADELGVALTKKQLTALVDAAFRERLPGPTRTTTASMRWTSKTRWTPRKPRLESLSR